MRTTGCLSLPPGSYRQLFFICAICRPFLFSPLHHLPLSCRILLFWRCWTAPIRPDDHLLFPYKFHTMLSRNSTRTATVSRFVHMLPPAPPPPPAHLLTRSRLLSLSRASCALPLSSNPPSPPGPSPRSSATSSSPPSTAASTPSPSSPATVSVPRSPRASRPSSRPTTSPSSGSRSTSRAWTMASSPPRKCSRRPSRLCAATSWA